MSKFFVEPGINEGFFIRESNHKVGALFTSGIEHCVGIAIGGYAYKSVHYELYECEKAIYLTHIMGVYQRPREDILLEIKKFIKESIRYFCLFYQTDIYIISKHTNKNIQAYTMKGIAINTILEEINSTANNKIGNNKLKCSVIDIVSPEGGLYFDKGEIKIASTKTDMSHIFIKPNSDYLVDYKIVMMDQNNFVVDDFDDSDLEQVQVIHAHFNKYEINFETYSYNEFYEEFMVQNAGEFIIDFKSIITIVDVYKKNIDIENVPVEYTIFYPQSKKEEKFFNIEDIHKHLATIKYPIDRIEFSIEFSENFNNIIEKKYDIMDLYFKLKYKCGRYLYLDNFMKCKITNEGRDKKFRLSIENNKIKLVDITGEH